MFRPSLAAPAHAPPSLSIVSSPCAVLPAAHRLCARLNRIASYPHLSCLPHLSSLPPPHRALQVVEDGYEFFARRQLVTLFSAPNYCGEFDNAGAMMSVDETLMCSFQVTHRAARRCVWYKVEFHPH